MLLAAALALAATPPYPVGGDTTPLTLPRPGGRAPEPMRYRVQQEVVPAREMGLVLLSQSELRVGVVETRPDGSRVWRAEPAAGVVDAWTDFGNVAGSDLAAIPAPPATRWVERRDGTVDEVTVEGAEGSAGATLAALVSGLGDQLRLPPPDGPVPVGGGWTRSQVMDLEVPVAEAVLRLHLSVTATYTFRGWSEVEGRRAAFVEGAAQLVGEGVFVGEDRVTPLAMWGRTGAWTWVDPADGGVVYTLAQAELSQAVGSLRFEPARDDVTTVRLSLARLDAGGR